MCCMSCFKSYHLSLLGHDMCSMLIATGTIMYRCKWSRTPAVLSSPKLNFLALYIATVCASKAAEYSCCQIDKVIPE